MISNSPLAAQISHQALEAGRCLNEIVLIAQDQCPPEELAQLKLAVGHVMAELLLKIMNPLYQAHPDLKPDQLIDPPGKILDSP